jgi:16S rRNA (guanine527-N7)-methyltransferase
MLCQFLPKLPTDQITKLNTLADLFLEWNQKLNLSAIRDRDGVIMKHVVDSLLILNYDPIRSGQKVLDLGTGGGFPGLALAIVYPEANFTLVDATEKKIRAVSAMAESLGLKNVKCVASRAEELGRDKAHREQYDVVVARALAGFSTLLEYCLPFVRPGGEFVAYQGPELADTWQEFQAVAEKLSAHITGAELAQLPDAEQSQRCFVRVEKTSVINKAYPRRIGIPKKKPLS